jgi:hypothetical protein
MHFFQGVQVRVWIMQKAEEYDDLPKDDQATQQAHGFGNVGDEVNEKLPQITLPAPDLLQQIHFFHEVGSVRQTASAFYLSPQSLAKELNIDEAFLNRLADEIRKDLG